jgi:hypothetical protein
LEIQASTIFENFSEILFEFFRNAPPPNEKVIEELVRQFVYQWDVVTTNFDSVQLYLYLLHRMNEDSGKYHVQSRGFEFGITDLETKEQLTDSMKESLNFESLPLIFERPWEDSGSYIIQSFEYLQPCNCILGPSIKESRSIPATQIITDLKAKFTEYGWDYENQDLIFTAEFEALNITTEAFLSFISIPLKTI